MTDNQGSNDQHEEQYVIKPNPKRDYEAHIFTMLGRDQQTQTTPNEQPIPLRKKHQNFIRLLLTTSVNQNSNNSQRQNQILIKKTNNTQPFKDLFISSTQQEQSSVFTQSIHSENENEDQQTDHYHHHIQTQIRQIQHQQTAQKIHLESANQPNQSQSDDDSQKESSIFFIPFQKTEQQIKALQSKQLQLIKAYTPLHESQISPWLNQEIKSIQDNIIRFHQEIFSFYTYIKPSRSQHQIRMAIFQSIKSIIISIYPSSRVFPFGSFATGLYLPDGDIDIVALIDYQQASNNRQKTKQFYNNIYQEFRSKYRQIYAKITYISSAKTPLVKMYHRETGFSIDISVNQTSGLEQIEEVNKMGQSYPEFKFMIFVLKVMLKIRNYSETFSGGIGSFLLVCMVFHFLREYHSLARPHQTKMVGLGEILLKFFSFYFMNVDFFKQTIHVKSGIVTSRPRRRNSISMLSPLDEESDIGKKAWKMKDILAMFKNRYKLITQKQFEPGQSILKELVNPTMSEFCCYDNQRQKPKDKEQENNFMEDFSKNLLLEISTVIKKKQAVVQPKVQEGQKKLKHKHRRYYAVDRKKTLQQREGGQEDENSESGGPDSLSY